jgi:hypothetical protein
MGDAARARFVGLVSLSALTLWITATIFSAVYCSLKCERWPQVSAQVTESRIDAIESSFGKHWIPYVEYKYQVGEKVYRSDRIRYLLPPIYDLQKASNISKPYPVGREVRIAYNADAPADSVLEPGLPAGAWQQIAIALFFCSLCLYIFFDIRSPKRRLQKAAPERPFHGGRDVEELKELR